MISDDLVNSYHLLLCALDLVYCNTLQGSSRKELLNPSFKGTVQRPHCLLYQGVKARPLQEHSYNNDLL